MHAVILLTYNGKHYLPDCFASLEKTDGVDWTLYCVDNASTDGTAEWLSDYARLVNAGAHHPLHDRFVNIGSSVNTGFAGGCNIGMEAAITDGATTVTLLNQDTVVDHGWLAALSGALADDPAIGAAQARMMLPDGVTINSLGNKLHFLGFGFTNGNNTVWENHKSKIVNHKLITYASGAAVMYRVSALRQVGLFDPSYFMYHEDLDLGWRLWRTGWKSALVSDAVVIHKYDFSRSIKKYYFMERNRLRVLLENYSLRTLLIIAPAFIAMELGSLLFGILKGWWREKLRAYAWFFRAKNVLTVLRARRKKRKMFTEPERAITERMVGKITDQEVRNSVLEYIANPLFELYWKIVRRML